MGVIIGLTGRKRSGKSTAARYLVDNHGFTELSFAARLKKMSVDVNPMVHYIDTLNLTEVDRELLAHGVEPGPVYLLDALRVLGEERAKDALPEVRRFYQRLGTEGVRNHIGADTWVNLAELEIIRVIRENTKDGEVGHADIVFADVRFENEAALIREWGGLVIEVYRPSQGDPEPEHSSEAGIGSDCSVVNPEGEPEALFAVLDHFINRIRKAPEGK